MKKLQIQSVEDLGDFLKQRTVEITTSVRDSIQQAFEQKKKTAILFEISVEDTDICFEVSVTTKEWVTALNSCLADYQKWELEDDAIDTYLLIKSIKQSLS
jgi:hypothetical protein